MLGLFSLKGTPAARGADAAPLQSSPPASAPDLAPAASRAEAVCPTAQMPGAHRPAWAFQAGPRRLKQPRGSMAAAAHALDGVCACCVAPQVCAARATACSGVLPRAPAAGAPRMLAVRR